MSYTNGKEKRFGRSPKSNKKDFSVVPSADIPRSVFDRSHGHKTTFDAGKLIPVFVDEALPGDTFHLDTSVLARLSTPIVPIMDNMTLDVHYFSVPYRLVWDNWQRFMGERTDPGDSTDFLIPQAIPDSAGGDTGFSYESVLDHMGVPCGVDSLTVSALPLRAYWLVFNEWFRDQNLQEAVAIDKGDSPVVTGGGTLFPRNKRHDYFTSCLPWPQKGTSVDLDFGVPSIAYAQYPMFKDSADGQDFGLYVSEGVVKPAGPGSEGQNPLQWSNIGIELEQSSAFTVNMLRQHFQVQKMLERDARGGTRYVEIIRSHFGVVSPDARLQRPEYLGCSTFDVNVNPVVQNGATTPDSPQGNLAAYGVSGGKRNGFSHSFTEHCIVLGIASVRSELTYQQGVNRMFNRKTRFDFYWPALAHLGEQAVLNKEICSLADGQDEAVFGYQERYAEYRYKPSIITGRMRSNFPQTLDAWHLSQKFESRPMLNSEFIMENPPLDRCLAVADEPHFIADFYFNLRCVRPMPTYSVPGMIDHF